MSRVTNNKAKGDSRDNELARPVRIALSQDQSVSGLLNDSTTPQGCFVFAHGAGAGVSHPFLSKVAAGLMPRGLSTLRYQFPYMEKGSGRPDGPAVAQAAVRAAVSTATSLLPGVPLFAGGKSFGGRMSSQAQAASPLSGVRGLIFLGFPLHPPGRPSQERGQHLFEIKIPMLFLQGNRDEFAELSLLESLVKQLGSRATLKLFANANHSFHVPAKSGWTDAEVLAEMLDAIKAWTQRLAFGDLA